MKLPVLASYAYLKNKPDFVNSLVRDPDLDLLIDSGAFTAFHSGKPIQLADYIDFIRRHKVKNYFTLDVIGDAEATREQYLDMLAEGLKPIPIFTRGAPIEHLAEYAKTSDFIALGGVSLKVENTLGYVSWFMQEAAKYPKLKVHWLGWSDHDMVLRHRPGSYDNSSWLWAKRHRYVAYLRNNRIQFMSWHKIKDQYRRPEIKRLAEAFGMEGADLLRNEAWQGADEVVSKMAAYTYLAYGRSHALRTGTKVYLVFGDQATFKTLKEVYNDHFKRSK